jgi:hypothetical protein
MAERCHRGNGKRGDEGRRRPGPDTLEDRIGKAADSRISPYNNVSMGQPVSPLLFAYIS